MADKHTRVFLRSIYGKFRYILCNCSLLSRATWETRCDTNQEEFVSGGDSVILGLGRRICPPYKKFVPVAAQILHSVQDDKKGRMDQS